MVLTNQFDLLMQFAVKELWRQGGKGQNGMKMDHGLTVIEAWLKTPRSRRRNKDRQGTGTGGVKKKKKKPSDRGRRGPHVKNRNQERRECKQYLSNRTQWENLKKVPLAKKTAMLSLGTRKMIRTLWRWKQQVSTIRKWCLGEKKKRKKEREEGREGRKECRNLLAVCSLRQQQTARTKTP